MLCSLVAPLLRRQRIHGSFFITFLSRVCLPTFCSPFIAHVILIMIIIIIGFKWSSVHGTRPTRLNHSRSWLRTGRHAVSNERHPNRAQLASIRCTKGAQVGRRFYAWRTRSFNIAALKLCASIVRSLIFLLGWFPWHFGIDFLIKFSTLGAPKSCFPKGKYPKAKKHFPLKLFLVRFGVDSSIFLRNAHGFNFDFLRLNFEVR